MSGPKLLVKIAEAAEMTSQSADTIRRAIKTTATKPKPGEPAPFPPPLKAKRGGKGEYLIPVGELQRWADSLPDA